MTVATMLRALVLSLPLLAGSAGGGHGEVFIRLEGAGPRIATAALGLQPVGEPRAIDVNGVPARLEIYRTRLPHRDLAARLEAQLAEWFARQPARSPFSLTLPVAVYGADYSTVAVAVAPIAGEGAAAVSFHARATAEGDTELAVTQYIGFPGTAPASVGGVAAAMALDGEIPAMAISTDDGATVAFEGRWLIEERLGRRTAMLERAGYTIARVTREGGGTFFAAAGADGVVQGYLSRDETGIVTEVMTVVGTSAGRK